MGVTRDLAKQVLALHQPDHLAAVLEAAGIRPRGSTRRELAHRVAERLWWSYCTPLGYAADRVTLERIVDHTAKRLGQAGATRAASDPWAKARALTRTVVPAVEGAGVSLDALDDLTRARARNAWLTTAAWGAGATSSFGARLVSGHVLKALSSPVGRLLPLLPPLAPYLRPVKAGARIAYAAGGPVGAGLALLTLNDALGTNYPTVVSLVLGLGSLPEVHVAEAAEVGGTVGPDDARPVAAPRPAEE
ncbi:MAG: hypothetical protein ACI8PZ_003792 [Myxococcota bacterium]